jgi:hypothetical protein
MEDAMKNITENLKRTASVVMSLLLMVVLGIDTVAAGPSKPVEVFVTDPVQIEADFSISGTTTQIGSGPIYTVPTGKRFVIEQITVRGLTPAADQEIALEIFTTLSNTVGDPSGLLRHMVGTVPRMGPGINVHTLSHHVRFYADPGTVVFLLVNRFAHGFGTLGGTATLHVTLVGHLQSAP